MSVYTQASGEFYICATPQPNELNLSQYEALTWLQIGNVGKVGESGTAENILSYPTIDTTVKPKSKGIADAGDPPLELARLHDDPGQIALRNAAKTRYIYATKYIKADAPDASFSNTVLYNRGIVSGPKRPNGGNEDFELEIFTFGYVQRELVADPEALSAPVNTRVPAIAGVAQVGHALVVIPGLWSGVPVLTYQWKKGGAPIGGATSTSYSPVIGDIGAAITVTETGTNSAGNAAATSGGTANVIAA